MKSGRKLGTWIVERLALRRALEAALEGLTPNEREVVVLLHVEGCTPREVAEHRECSADAVRKLSRTALAKLAEELEERFRPE